MIDFKKLKERRFKQFGEYRLDRWIFQSAMWLCFAWLFFVAYSSGFSLDYFHCPENADGSISGLKIMLKDYDLEGAVVDGNCRNPFYKDTWKNHEYLPPGEYGNKPGFLFNSVKYVIFGLFAWAILLNHYIYNKGFKFKRLKV